MPPGGTAKRSSCFVPSCPGEADRTSTVGFKRFLDLADAGQAPHPGYTISSTACLSGITVPDQDSQYTLIAFGMFHLEVESPAGRVRR